MPKFFKKKRKHKGGIAPAIIGGLVAASPAIASFLNNLVDRIAGKGKKRVKKK